MKRAPKDPVAFAYSCSGCSKIVVLKDPAAPCPKCGSLDRVFVGNRYAKEGKC